MKYLAFELDDETFGVPVELVQEVLEHTTVTRVPRCPEFLLGIINLRGSIVAVMDLRRRLGIEERKISVDTRLVVINLTIEEHDTAVALMADSVHEVVEIADDDIDPAPTVDTSATSADLIGVGKRNEAMILLLDASSLLTAQLLEQSFGNLGPDPRRHPGGQTGRHPEGHVGAQGTLSREDSQPAATAEDLPLPQGGPNSLP